MTHIKTNTVQNIFRILLGLAMIYAGIAHLSFERLAFQAQVPDWLPMMNKDFVVIASGVIEIIFGMLMVWSGRLKVKTGIALAVFYVLIFPGNISQYVNEINSFGLDTNKKRLIRLFFQPVLVLWALWSSGGLKYLRLKKTDLI